jgi:hypothetical protein
MLAALIGRCCLTCRAHFRIIPCFPDLKALS